MKKRNLLLIAGMMTALLLTGCQSNSTDAETEALKQQIAQLEQQVATLEQQSAGDTDAKAAESSAPEAAEGDAADKTGTEQAAAADNNAQADTSGNASGQTVSATTHTMEELTDMVDAYVEKVNAASTSGTESENLEQFFTLKQEEKQIDNDLDLHEDELEAEYHKGNLSREEYKSLERELDKLEDKLDLAEDRLELTFGIRD